MRPKNCCLLFRFGNYTSAKKIKHRKIKPAGSQKTRRLSD
jgi:hypothetical protein